MGDFDVPDEIHEVLEKRNFFLIIGHQNPDGDCLSSQKALGSFLTRMGKKVSLLSPGPFDRPEIESQKKYFIPHLPENIKKENPLVIVVDCSTIERIGYLAEEIKGLDVAVIDHHDSGASFGSIKYIRPKAPSVTFLIHRIIESFNEKPTKEEAELLLFGIATDTGFFRHLEAYSDEFFHSVAKLTAAGASP
ncbi:MAG: DHH family phosphoesterase, partial [Spirochaetales bacterium]|nr:DHH family phosphoesterase [Spirochaetales bacterium]